MQTLSTEALYAYFKRHPQVVTDSRRIVAGCIFLALKGENFDGNRFAAQALRDGASYAIVDDAQVVAGEKYLLVEDGLASLQALAHYHRKQFDIPVIAITGSNGKTTTKELVSSVLGSHYRTHFTRGNLNNHIGVPLTLLSLSKHTEVAVIEMGANHQGEIKVLCNIAAPTHGLITNIGKAHLEGFGGVEGVKKGKGELYDYLKANKSVIFINQDEAFLPELLGSYSKRIPYFISESPSPDHYGYETVYLEANPYLKVAFLGTTGTLETLQTQLIGKYNFNNIMTAIALGRYFKVPTEKMKKAIADYHPTNNRSQRVEKGSNVYILDAYNANPTSMRHALANLGAQQATTKIAILGDMLELGIYSEVEHRLMIDYCLSLKIDRIILVGKIFSNLEGFPTTEKFADVASLNAWYAQQVIQNSLILIKGSRGIALEQLVLT